MSNKNEPQKKEKPEEQGNVRTDPAKEQPSRSTKDGANRRKGKDF